MREEEIGLAVGAVPAALDEVEHELVAERLERGGVERLARLEIADVERHVDHRSPFGSA